MGWSLVYVQPFNKLAKTLRMLYLKLINNSSDKNKENQYRVGGLDIGGRNYIN